MQNTIAACEQAGHRDGLAAGLALALAGLDAGAAPGGIAALPAVSFAAGAADPADPAGRVGSVGPVATLPAGAAVIRHEMALAEGISFVRPATRSDVPAGELTALAARLGAVRIGATLRLAEAVTAHLSRRLFGGEPVLAKQLVQGTLADALVTTETARSGLATDDRAAIVDIHDRLTRIDWQLARMLGASGYVGRNPACAAYVSRLVANCWVARDAAVAVVAEAAGVAVAGVAGVARVAGGEAV